MDATAYKTPPALDRARARALAIGVTGVLLAAAGGLMAGGVERSLFSYLVGFSFWTGISLGCLALAMLHQLSGGKWGVVVRRPLEAAALTLPLMAVLLLPLLAGLGQLYEWAKPDVVAGDHVLQYKSAYLNVPFFVARQVVYFAIWIGLTFFLTRWSSEQDRTGNPEFHHKLRALSGPGLALYALTVTFASVDWVMSLDPHWFSTIFGILTIGGQALGALAFIVAVLVLLSRIEPMSEVVTPQHLHDLGKLMLAFVMLWAYFALSQFLIIWAGNLPEEIPWYLRRFNTGWRWIGLSLALLHFALPFALLLSRDLKRKAERLIWIAALVIVMRMVDTVWLIAPEFHADAHAVGALSVFADVLALVGFGGIWVWYFLSRLRARPLMPLHDPNLDPAAAEVEA